MLQKRFAEYIASGRISGIDRIDDCCVLAAVGQGMVARKGVAATLFGALAKANINIRAMAQVSMDVVCAELPRAWPVVSNVGCFTVYGAGIGGAGKECMKIVEQVYCTGLLAAPQGVGKHWTRITAT